MSVQLLKKRRIQGAKFPFEAKISGFNVIPVRAKKTWL